MDRVIYDEEVTSAERDFPSDRAVDSNSSVRSKAIEWLCPTLTDAPFDPMRAFGMAAWLWTQSSMHRRWPVQLLASSIWPAVHHRQFLLARDKDSRPIAYVSWALFNEASERKYLRDPNSIEYDDWKSGNRIWFIDWIAPFGNVRAVARKIENDIFPDSAGHSLHVKEGSDTGRIIDHFGKNVSLEQKQLAVDQLKRNLVAAFSEQRN